MLEKIFEKTNFHDALLIVIASIAIVGFWRGTWYLMDTFLFPTNQFLSSISSIIIGLVILLIIAAYRKKSK